MDVDINGSILPKHEWFDLNSSSITEFLNDCRDPKFSLSEFILETKARVRTWRRVFWKVWGLCHTLYCDKCQAHFQVG